MSATSSPNHVGGPPLPPEIAAFAQRGWHLFPCGRRRKKPLISSWPRLASSDPFVLQRWSEEHPHCNWAITTGSQSGVFVLDVDGEAGRASLAALESKHGPLPVTLTVITGREDGGEQRYFVHPVSHEVRSSTTKLGPGLHIRGAGGYAIVPPSIHPSGKTYMFVNESIPIAEGSEWLLDLLVADDDNSARQPPPERFILREGERNDGLARNAGFLRRGGADLPEIERKLLEANKRRCRPPLDEREVRRIAVSVARYPIGGPDPLEFAWHETAARIYPSEEERFLELCRCLQKARTDQEIVLPLQRIGELMDIHWTTVSRYRRNAVRRGMLTPTAEYVAGKRAGRYVFNERQKGAGAGAGRPTSTPANYERAKYWLSEHRVAAHSEHFTGNGVNLHSEHGSYSEQCSYSERGSREGASCDAAALNEEASIAKARARGESLGFTGIFLSSFIERELVLMKKWAAGRRSQTAGAGWAPERETFTSGRGPRVRREDPAPPTTTNQSKGATP
jgi:hypothetical protein